MLKDAKDKDERQFVVVSINEKMKIVLNRKILNEKK